MASGYRTYRTEGSSALVPSYPVFTLLEGGTGTTVLDEGRGQGLESRGQDSVVVATTRGDLLTVIVCTVLVGLGLAVALFAGNALVSARRDAALSALPGQEVVVESGDSIWGLASEHPVDGYSTSELVQWITEKNSLSSSNLVPGQAIEVPVSR
ncbi:MAG: LysM peptidoglycan-binding domain-containing protein [Olsenella sp.]|jgi:hypothetical protein|nr:LysM peptidoglycan-binding domain-containing protein [Olsenella sp.]